MAKGTSGKPQSGGMRQVYGCVIRDRIKTADPQTLRAYKIVGEDLLKDASGAHEDAEDLRAALKDLDHALSGKK
jgi:hypothetical protein